MSWSRRSYFNPAEEGSILLNPAVGNSLGSLASKFEMSFALSVRIEMPHAAVSDVLQKLHEPECLLRHR